MIERQCFKMDVQVWTINIPKTTNFLRISNYFVVIDFS